MKSGLDSNLAAVPRLFSNLEPVGERLQHQPGSVLGCTALVAGTTIGAGMLALPSVTLPSGVVPSTVMLITLWFYALASGLLIAEVHVNTIRDSGRTDAGLLTMIEATLGPSGAHLAGGAYLFQHYALLVAYLAQGGEILVAAIAQMAGLGELPRLWGTFLFVGILGGILYFGRQRLVERLNNTLVALVIVSFIGLLVLGTAAIDPAQFHHQNWRALMPSISVMFVALFYHNVIPVVTTQLEGDVRQIRQAIAWGSLIPLLMFLSWNLVVLGSVRPEMLADLSVFDPLQVLRRGGAGPWLGGLLSLFSELAIATSFIGFVYGLLDFFRDALDVSPHDPTKRLPLYSLVLLPPLGLSALNPDIFFIALDYAGTFSITIISGIFPALMAWKLRDRQSHTWGIPPLVPGGKPLLVVMIGVALMVIGQQLLTSAV